MSEKKLSPQIKRHLIWIFSTVCFLLIYVIFGDAGIVLFILIFIPFWGIFSIIDGIRFIRHRKWYLVPFSITYKSYFENEKVIAWMSILCGIGFLALWIWIIIFILQSE